MARVAALAMIFPKTTRLENQPRFVVVVVVVVVGCVAVGDCSVGGIGCSSAGVVVVVVAAVEAKSVVTTGPILLLLSAAAVLVLVVVVVVRVVAVLEEVARICGEKIRIATTPSIMLLVVKNRTIRRGGRRRNMYRVVVVVRINWVFFDGMRELYWFVKGRSDLGCCGIVQYVFGLLLHITE